MEIYTEWVNLKTLISDKSLDIFYKEYEFYYEIYTLNGFTRFFTEIYKDITKCKGLNIEQNDLNKEDFETNYKLTAREI